MTTQSRPARLILTRPRAQADRFAADIADGLPEGLKIVTAPLMEIVLDDPGSLDGFAGLVLTSENGALALAPLRPVALPAFCVGPRTRDVAQSMGCTARALGGSAAALVEALLELRPKGPLLHLHGAHTRGNVAETLDAAGLPCAARCVYDQVAQPLPQGLRDDLAAGAPDIVALFSPRSAALFLADCPAAPAAQIVCLSPAVAAVLAAGIYGGVFVSDAPTGPAMAAALYRRAAAKRLEGPGTSS